jgi:glycerophosphoryl diester phosphodiesterase
MKTTSTATPIVIAHRGASGYLPEHTLAAKAMAHAMGADYIEQDVVLSRDGVPLILHDVYLESTTDVAHCFPARARADGRYYAMDFTLAELSLLKVHERSELCANGQEKAVYPGRYPLGPGLFAIPTLEQEIELIAGLDESRKKRTGLYVELKAPNLHASAGMDIAVKVLEVLMKKGYDKRPQQVYLQCFDGPTLQRLRHELKTPLPLIQLIGENGWGEDTATDYDYLRSAQGLSEVASYADGIGPWLNQIYLGRSKTGEVILSDLTARAQALGLQVHPYTLRRDDLPDGITSFSELLDIFFGQARVDGIFTDFPDLARQHLQRL